MNRRDALKSITLLLGGALAGSRSFLSGQINDDAERFADRLTERQLRLLDEVGETILPRTPESPGAKAAGIGAFMREIVSQNYSVEERRVFLAGLEELDRRSETRADRNFLELSPEDRYELLLELEKDESAGYYRMMKELTLWGYFSSEVGATQALAHLPVPGRWEPCIEVGPDTKAWS